MRNFKIKVCGITNTEDAAEVVRLGADYVGFIFYEKSPRYISPQKAIEIIDNISSDIIKVGVFVNHKLEEMVQIANNLKLDYIQLSGDETDDVIRDLLKNNFKVIKTIRITSNTDFNQIRNSTADIIHLDNADKGEYGGSGKPFDWNIAIPDDISNLMIAGGINAENVSEAVKRFRPMIVDVNSGVEKSPGIKDINKLRDFFKVCDRI